MQRYWVRRYWQRWAQEYTRISRKQHAIWSTRAIVLSQISNGTKSINSMWRSISLLICRCGTLCMMSLNTLQGVKNDREEEQDACSSVSGPRPDGSNRG